MEFLKLLEGIRTPALNAFFSAVTVLGEETFFILVGLIFYWCINKKNGHYLLFVGLFGTVANQFLKITCRIPRPWVQDTEFTIVESAREAASGYSFPSGHTQSAVGTFGTVAAMRREKWLRAICILFCILVPFSRMYLGVHTPQDVCVALLMGMALVLIFRPLLAWAEEKPLRMHLLFAAVSLLCIAYAFYVNFGSFPPDIDAENLLSAQKNGAKMLGCFLGLWLAYLVDNRWVHFEEKASFAGQILKLVLGLVPVLLIKILLKAPLIALCGNSAAADGIRYFLIAFFAGGIWPMTFPHFSKIGRKKQ